MAGARFRLAHHPDLRRRQFEDETLVFNPRLWQTHLLNASAAFVLDRLEEGPASASELAAELAGETPEAEIAAEQLEDLLEELADLGLVEPERAA